MPRRAPPLSFATSLLLAAFLCCGTVLAGARIELSDGQHLSGTDLRLVGTDYLLELESGKVVSVPVELVASVRLTGGEDPDEESVPNGLTFIAPQQLAGEPVTLRRAHEQLEVFDEPASFARGVVDSDWRPRGEWAHRPPGLDFNPARWANGVIDPYWIPRSGFPSRDVLRPGRAGWRPDIIDMTWRPADGFAGDAGLPGRDEVPGGLLAAGSSDTVPDTPRTLAGDCGWCRTPRSRDEAERFRAPARPSPQRVDVPGCARSIFEQSPLAPIRTAIEIRELPSTVVATVPLRLHEATLEHAEGIARAIYAVANNACVLLAGDLLDLGVVATPELAADYTRSAYDALLGRAPQEAFATDEEKIRYAFGMAALADAAAFGEVGSDFVLLDSRDTLDGVLAPRAAGCSASQGRQRRARGAAARQFALPRIAEGESGDRIRFDVWSRAGGFLLRYEVRLATEGGVSIERDKLAEHVGKHDDQRS